MKVWIVCDNNNKENFVIPFVSLEAAQKYQKQYSGLTFEDCWILDEEGTLVMEE